MLEHKGVEVHDIIVRGGTSGWDTMMTRTGGRTTPQILINDEIIGGYNELAVLNAQGILDAKLGLPARAERDTLWPGAERSHGHGAQEVQSRASNCRTARLISCSG